MTNQWIQGFCEIEPVTLSVPTGDNVRLDRHWGEGYWVSDPYPPVAMFVQIEIWDQTEEKQDDL